MKVRPDGFVDYTTVLSVIDKSIDSVNRWADLTNDRFGDREIKVEHLNELKDIILILSWRYSHENVSFMFTARKKELESFIPIYEIIGGEDSLISDYWNGRVHVEELEASAHVYINF